MNVFTNINFAYPWVLVLLLIIPFFIFLKYKKKNIKGILIPSISAFNKHQDWMGVVYNSLYWIRLIIISLLILVLARPQTVNSSEILDKEKGIDIIIAVDISFSMLTKDLMPNRLEVVKKVAKEFVEKRYGDRIGLIAYSGDAVTLVPITTDREILYEELNNLNTKILEQGTNIGDGLVTAVNHLKDSKAKSKVIILLTDGVNTITKIASPEAAADIAAKENIKVYTIGVGTNGKALFPYINNNDNIIGYKEQEVKIDEARLKLISQKTNGKYFRAINAIHLQDIYNYIDQLEKSDINDLRYYHFTEKYQIFLIPAVLLLLLELFLRITIFRTIE